MNPKAIILALSTVALAGCSTPRKPIPLPNGGQGFSVSCINDQETCYKDAATTCKGPYELTDRTSQITYLGYGQTMTTLTYMVECKKQ